MLAWFRGMGRGYQWEINKALQRLMEEERRAGSRWYVRFVSPTQAKSGLEWGTRQPLKLEV